jgi:hypothetical protein
MTIEPKIKKRIDEIAERTKRALIDGNGSVCSVLEFALPTYGFALASKNPDEAMRYALDSLSKVTSYVSCYNSVKDFLGQIHPTAFSTGLMGNPESTSAYVVLFEKGNIVTAQARVNRIVEVEREQGSYGVTEPEIERIKSREWDGNIETVVDDIEKKERGCIVLAGGAEYMPQDMRIGFASSLFVMQYYERTKHQRGKS